jgi:ABC-type amino acid transport substrate-binding protein
MRLSVSVVSRTACALLGLVLSAAAALAADIDEIKARGELRHIGIRYANFVTGDGFGFDVELMQGFARHLGVEYTLVYSDFYTVVRDLLGKDVARNGPDVALTGDYPVRGDVISTGFTRLPWRESVLLFSEPTFPSQVLLVAPAASPVKPIRPTGNLEEDIRQTRQLIDSHSLLVMERTCLDPANYGLKGVGIDLKSYTKSTNLNEIVPALLNGEAELALLDVPDAILDLKKWAGQIKVIGPISGEQTLATAFPLDAPGLRDEFNAYLRSLKASGAYRDLVSKHYPGIKRFFPDFFAATN